VGLTTILVPAATIPPPQPAVDAASVLARILGCSDVRFLVLHVGAEDDAPSVRVSQEPGWTCERLVRAGDTVDEILGIAAGRSADLIAMTTQGHKGFLDALRGSTTERLLRSAPCPVLAVPATYPDLIARFERAPSRGVPGPRNPPHPASPLWGEEKR
jgi:hypothetical protein